ncbi:hypothetical protein DL765_007455 [Monosporascus sp. GIB2]|nr:hypothetical protein DL765_007455 [Monosporascus sp. GIB2]
MRDRDLSDEGRQQCAELLDALPWVDKVTHLVSSPHATRLELVPATFEPVISTGKRIVALPELTDTGMFRASFVLSKRVLAAKFGGKVDLGLLTAGWDAPKPEGGFGCSPEEWLEHRATAGLLTRVVRLRRGGGERVAVGTAATLPSDAHVVVVTHGLLAHFPTEEFKASKFRAVVTRGPLEYRSFQFAAEPKDNVRLVETWESRLRKNLPIASTMSD